MSDKIKVVRCADASVDQIDLSVKNKKIKSFGKELILEVSGTVSRAYSDKFNSFIFHPDEDDLEFINSLSLESGARKLDYNTIIVGLLKTVKLNDKAMPREKVTKYLKFGADVKCLVWASNITKGDNVYFSLLKICESSESITETADKLIDMV